MAPHPLQLAAVTTKEGRQHLHPPVTSEADHMPARYTNRGSSVPGRLFIEGSGAEEEEEAPVSGAFLV
jgi:hypothetical protein